MLIALPLYLVVGSVALASLTVKPQQRARPMPAAASAEECPVTHEGQPVGAAQLASLVQEQKPAAEAKPAEEKPGDSTSCLSCHGEIESAHPSVTNVLKEGGGDERGVTCVGCHGGTGEWKMGRDGKPLLDQNLYHVMPRFPDLWKKSAQYRKATGDPQRPYAYPSGNPERTYALLNREKADFIRFVNPGDLRVAQRSCGTIGTGASCHGDIVHQVRKCMMTHGGFLYGAALYNNGVLPNKDALVGESYSPVRYGADGKTKDQYGHSLPEAILGITEGMDGQISSRPPKPEEAARGVLPFLVPLPRWEISQVGNIFRQFERGGLKKPPQSEVGNPNREEDPGKPDEKLSSRGHGTVLRTDPQVLGAQKTRLLDPLLSLLGTNDHPGDYRSSGCSGCHYTYANDRDPTHSGPYAKYGHLGHSFSKDKALATAQKTGERGHPITHGMVWKEMPTSQCIVCHIHPGTNMVSTYLGYTWWDNETDADQGMYPPTPRTPSNHERDRIQQSNPEASALKGNWGDTKFLENVTDLNPKLKHSQFADFHGHGWVFRAAFKRDRKGNLLDKEGKKFWPPDNWKPGDSIPVPDWKKGVHLKDIHLEKGMHCVDCHFKQDNHGTGKIYSEGRAAIEIACEDCHGGVSKPSALALYLDGKDDTTGVTSAAAGGRKIEDYDTVRKNDTGDLTERWYKKDDGTIWQRSAVELVEGEEETDGKKVKVRVAREWPVAQIADLIDPKSKSYNAKAALAKTIRQDGRTWGIPPAPGSMSSSPSGHLAHDGNKMTCFGCHSAWTTSCFGCHLSMTANNKKRNLHNEGQYSRNWVAYNFQTLRDDLYMLGKDGVNTGNRVAPVRSACAVLVSSQNQQRDWIYYQQQTVSSEGYSGTSFSSYVPHTVRGKETKQCTDCHLSERNDNNAWMANLMLQGTNSVNHIGRYAYVANEDGMSAIMVAEREEPTAVIGSYLHRLAYPDKYKSHVDRGRRLGTAQDHHGHTLSVQLRGEYLYAAEGPEGTVIYDVANVDNKNFSERIVTSPVSPWGQRFFVRSKYAVAVASPSTMLIDPARKQFPENREQTPIHPLYKYIYILDKYEGLIVVKALTLMDGNPTNNFLSREKLSNGLRAWNPDGVLNGATSIQIAGRWVYITSERGLAIVDIDRPTAPKLVRVVSGFHKPNAVAVQFRYAFVTDEEGLKVVDITTPEQAALVQGATMRLDHCHSVYLSRTYAYIAAGPHGVAIVDVENPERPKLDQIFNAGGQINDAHDVKIGTTINCFYAYVADGKNGLRILQLTAPDRTPGLHGYSPRPMPELIATYKTPGPALNVSEGLDRDRAVDESGNQLSVFGRKGARPFNLDEQRRMYMRNGQLFRVSDDFPSQAVAPEANLTRPVRLAMTEWLGLLPVAGLLLARKARRGGILVPWRRRRRRPTA